jgi:hypothetical protein
LKLIFFLTSLATIRLGNLKNEYDNLIPRKGELERQALELEFCNANFSDTAGPPTTRFQDAFLMLGLLLKLAHFQMSSIQRSQVSHK